MTQYLWCFIIAFATFFSGVAWHGYRSYWAGYSDGTRIAIDTNEAYLPAVRAGSYWEGRYKEREYWAGLLRKCICQDPNTGRFRKRGML